MSGLNEAHLEAIKMAEPARENAVRVGDGVRLRDLHGKPQIFLEKCIVSLVI
jgi:hypothetical protein